ncbi:MAG: hypothetical protein WAW61_16020 [Methylococcaceae bacterium]
MKGFLKILLLLLLCYGLFFVFQDKIPSDLLDLISNDLSRNKARSILAETYPSEKILRSIGSSQQITTISTQDGSVMNFEKETKQILDNLKNADYIDITTTTRLGYFGGLFYNITFKPKLSPYIENKGEFMGESFVKVKIADTVFNEITGIRKVDDNQYIVEFSTKTVTNPLGEIFPLKSYEGGNGSHSVHFVKYDDGWRYGK